MFDLFHFIIQKACDEEVSKEGTSVLRGKSPGQRLSKSSLNSIIGEADEIQEYETSDDSPPEAATQMVLWPGEVFSNEVIRSEVNFLILPFFALSRRDASQRSKTEYHAIVKRGDATLDVHWGVYGHPRYGYPRPFDGQVHKTIEQVIGQLQRPIENPVPLGSLYRIAKLMGLRDSGRVYQDIKMALQRTVATVIESKGTF